MSAKQTITLIASKKRSSMKRKKAVRRQLVEVGLCSACADNIAQYYVYQPKSHNGRQSRPKRKAAQEAEVIEFDGSP